MNKHSSPKTVETVNNKKIIEEIVQDTSVSENSKFSAKKVKLKTAFKTIKKVLHFGKPYNAFLFSALFFVLVSNVFELLIPIYIGKCVDNLIGIGSVAFKPLLKTAIILILIVLASALFNWLANIFTNKYYFKTTARMREAFFEKMNKVPLSFIDTNKHGDLLSRMINDVDILADGIAEGLSTITNGVATIIGTIISMLLLNVPLALIVIILTPLSLLTSLTIAKKSYKLFAGQAKEEGEVNAYLEEYISGGRVVKAFNFEKQSIDDFDSANKKYYKVSEKAEYISSLANPVTRFINTLVYASVAFVSVLMIIKGGFGITVGLVSTFLTYANSYGRPFNELSNEITDLQGALASSERVFNVLDAKEESSDDNLPELLNVDGNIKVENAHFSYVPEKKLIQNFNLKVKAGQKIAIVGPTGCGKTTFINLLMRFYDLTKGAIYVDDTNISQVKRNSLRSKYGMVLQESWLYNASIKDNIAYGKPTATLEEVVEVSKVTGVHDFVSLLPNGYDTIVTEGSNNISQGQKQLICIARIMLTKPPMLILDEATSNIDTRSEIKIQQAFDKLMEGRTTFIVAHRLSTIKNADIILVMNKGNIIEQGTHEQLLAKKGFYFNLYNSQFAKVDE